MSNLVELVQNSYGISNFIGNVCVESKFQSKGKNKKFCGINDMRYRQVHMLFFTFYKINERMVFKV